MSSAAKHIVASSKIVKSMYPWLFHVIGVAHLLLICAAKASSHSEDVDLPIAEAKPVTGKK